MKSGRTGVIFLCLAAGVAYLLLKNSNGGRRLSTDSKPTTTTMTQNIHIPNRSQPPPPTLSTLSLVSLSPLVTKSFTPLTQEQIDGVEKFVFFVGYARSGHSIIGSMMDAHPNMVISHEYMLFQRLARNKTSEETRNKTTLFNTLYKKTYNDVINGWKSSKRNGKGYTLQMQHSWQRTFSTLRVIGDISGGKTVMAYRRSVPKFTRQYRELVRKIGIPVRVLHVVRNPYDMISTQVLFTRRLYGKYHIGKINASHKYNSAQASLRSYGNVLLGYVKTAQDMIQALNLTVLEIHKRFCQQP